MHFKSKHTHTHTTLTQKRMHNFSKQYREKQNILKPANSKRFGKYRSWVDKMQTVLEGNLLFKKNNNIRKDGA